MLTKLGTIKWMKLWSTLSAKVVGFLFIKSMITITNLELKRFTLKKIPKLAILWLEIEVADILK